MSPIGQGPVRVARATAPLSNGPENATLLHCPIRGPLGVTALAKNGFTATEEALRIDFIHFLIERNYPEDHIAVETIILKKIGESGRNSLRCDVIVYDIPAQEASLLGRQEALRHAIVVAEIKRDSARANSAKEHQLEPALRLLPKDDAIGAYWDNMNRAMLIKQSVRGETKIIEDNLSRLPLWGDAYKSKKLTIKDLTPSQNLVGLLFNIANIMRSHGVNDEHIRYKETVKLILARYCDERDCSTNLSKPLSLQVFPGADPDFMDRVAETYRTAAIRYSRAKTLFGKDKGSELKERTLRDMIYYVQGVDFRSASNDTMQQIFMSFVPAVFKKALDQYFTPIELVKTMVGMCDIGPNDKVADPGMGTADFLTAACDLRSNAGDTDIAQRIYGFDSDERAYDLAVINMILNKDGQSNLHLRDSIADFGGFVGEMGVVLCNPPFGEKSVETRLEVLKNYDLGHEWIYNEALERWQKSKAIMSRQQLGILFIEKCFKLAGPDARIAIILPEGYLCTPLYTYVRQWIIEKMKVIGVVELPRRMFVKSNADLRSNIVILQKLSPAKLKKASGCDYPIYADMVRKVGFKLGKGYSPLYKKDKASGIELRNEENKLITDTDFTRINSKFEEFSKKTKWRTLVTRSSVGSGWDGASLSDIVRHPSLDMKPRRLMPAALANIRNIEADDHLRLCDIADVVTSKIDIAKIYDPADQLRLVAGMDIQAVEGIVRPSAPIRVWQLADDKGKNLFRLKNHDIVIGLVRPERRNIGMLFDTGEDIVGVPDGIAIVRIKEKFKDKYSQSWLLAALRSEDCRLQFWTESGGTSYGKLNDDHINNVLIRVPPKATRAAIAKQIDRWAELNRDRDAVWSSIGSDSDRRPILNSSGFGLIDGEDAYDEDDAD